MKLVVVMKMVSVLVLLLIVAKRIESSGRGRRQSKYVFSVGGGVVLVRWIP